MSDSVNVASQQHNDEIDLVEIIRILWDKKWWIILSSFVTALLAGVYAFTAKEQWTSKATVIGPRITELGKLLPIRAEYARITENSEFTAGGLAKGLHDNFKHFLLSDDLKEEFLKQSPWLATQTEGKSEQEKAKFISDTVTESLKIHKPDNKKKDEKELEEIGLKISFSAEKPEDAQHILKQYIDYINSYTVNEINEEFKVSFDLRLENLRFAKQQISSNLDESKTVQVENLEKALDIAKKAGITDFSRNTTTPQNAFIMPEYLSGEAKLNISDSKLADGTYLFMLGEKYLQAQLDIAKEKGFAYPLNYYQVDRQISQLEPLSTKLDSINGVKAYRYLASPDYPVNKDKPKRILILIVGFILGLVLSTFTLVIKSLIKK